MFASSCRMCSKFSRAKLQTREDCETMEVSRLYSTQLIQTQRLDKAAWRDQNRMQIGWKETPLKSDCPPSARPSSQRVFRLVGKLIRSNESSFVSACSHATFIYLLYVCGSDFLWFSTSTTLTDNLDAECLWVEETCKKYEQKWFISESQNFVSCWQAAFKVLRQLLLQMVPIQAASLALSFQA